nr:transcription repressor OFP7-like [Tanacetum cinerariifolium]
MFNFKFSLPSFRLCRRKTKLPVATRLFSPYNPKAIEIGYPNIPSPPPTTPVRYHDISISKKVPLTTTPEFNNSPVSFDIIKKHEEKNMDTYDESGWLSDNVDSFKKSGGKTKKTKDAEVKRKSIVMKESLTVVKWSKQPYDDFKRSMLEMILEKEMYESKDLEELLQWFLTLNSRHHHADIVAAFTEIWELLFV